MTSTGRRKYLWVGLSRRGKLPTDRWSERGTHREALAKATQRLRRKRGEMREIRGRSSRWERKPRSTFGGHLPFRIPTSPNVKTSKDLSDKQTTQLSTLLT